MNWGACGTGDGCRGTVSTHAQPLGLFASGRQPYPYGTRGIPPHKVARLPFFLGGGKIFFMYASARYYCKPCGSTFTRRNYTLKDEHCRGCGAILQPSRITPYKRGRYLTRLLSECGAELRALNPDIGSTPLKMYVYASDRPILVLPRCAETVATKKYLRVTLPGDGIVV